MIAATRTRPQWATFGAGAHPGCRQVTISDGDAAAGHRVPVRE